LKDDTHSLILNNVKALQETQTTYGQNRLSKDGGTEVFAIVTAKNQTRAQKLLQC
jgi:hypothetical protein